MVIVTDMILDCGLQSPRLTTSEPRCLPCCFQEESLDVQYKSGKMSQPDVCYGSGCAVIVAFAAVYRSNFPKSGVRRE